jgi:hypothetical protein
LAANVRVVLACSPTGGETVIVLITGTRFAGGAGIVVVVTVGAAGVLLEPVLEPQAAAASMIGRVTIAANRRFFISAPKTDELGAATL